MHLARPAVLALALLAPGAAADAPPTLLARTSEHIAHAHRVALRHSAGLARDLRVALRGILADAPAPRRRAHPAPHPGSDSTRRRYARDGAQSPIQQHEVYCVTTPRSTSPAPGGLPPPAGGNGTASTAGGATSTARGGATPTTTGGGPAPTGTSAYTLFEAHSGTSFFNGWTFFTGGDPTNGIAEFVDGNTASASNLTYFTADGDAVMRADTTPVVTGNRNSVRITTNSHFTFGIVVLDAVHMPTGCGTWPAFWTNGPNWPAGGEIDIVEGVNSYTHNQMTIHTNPGCTLPANAAAGMSGQLVAGTNCAAAQTGNQGCGVRSSEANYGASFNSAGGGVYAMKWDAGGIEVYFFPRNAIPADITAGALQPASWGAPDAFWPSDSCNTSQFFYQHSVIFDTTFCGDWAGGVWSATGIPGQDTSCAAMTGHSTCEDYVRNSGASLSEAYWQVSSVKIYQAAS